MAILIDVSPMIHRSIHMNREAVIENPKFICHLVGAMILSSADKFGACKSNPVICAIDGKNNWRKQYYEKNKPDIPEYKDQKYKGKRVKDEAFDWEAIYSNVAELMDSFKLHSDFHVVEIDRAEADDVIAVYARSTDEMVTIITSDKDMKQCQRKNVVMYDPIKQMFIPEIDVDRFKKLHCMIGDKSDNILAIKARVGEKTAEKLLPELDDMLATNPEVRARYEFNQHLIDFDFIPEEVAKEIQEQISLQQHSFHAMNLLKCFTKMGLEMLSEKVSKFKLTDQIVSAKIVNNESTKQQKEEFENNLLDKFFS